MDSERFNEFKNKVWPQTKKELEKGMESTKKMIIEGEKHIKALSQKSIKNATAPVLRI